MAQPDLPINKRPHQDNDSDIPAVEHMEAIAKERRNFRCECAAEMSKRKWLRSKNKRFDTPDKVYDFCRGYVPDGSTDVLRIIFAFLADPVNCIADADENVIRKDGGSFILQPAPTKNRQRTFTVRADAGVPMKEGSYYYELQNVHSDSATGNHVGYHTGVIWVGWRDGDSSRFVVESFPNLRDGDVIGCGIQHHSGEFKVLFYVNGKSRWTLSTRWAPMHCPYPACTVNGHFHPTDTYQIRYGEDMQFLPNGFEPLYET